MGFHIIENDPTHATTARTPETVCPGPRLQGPGFRFYSPPLGRWLSKDPVGNAGGINIYAFVANRPLQFMDPFGLTFKDLGEVFETQPIVIVDWETDEVISPSGTTDEPTIAKFDVKCEKCRTKGHKANCYKAVLDWVVSDKSHIWLNVFKDPSVSKETRETGGLPTGSIKDTRAYEKKAREMAETWHDDNEPAVKAEFEKPCGMTWAQCDTWARTSATKKEKWRKALHDYFEDVMLPYDRKKRGGHTIEEYGGWRDPWSQDEWQELDD